MCCSANRERSPVLTGDEKDELPPENRDLPDSELVNQSHHWRGK